MHRATSDSDSIKTETNDLIVFHNKRLRTFFAIFGVGVAFMMYFALGVPSFWGRLISIFILALFGLVAVCNCLADKTVTIDKKSQSIVFQINSPIKRFESVRKIAFSALKEIKITSYRDEGELIWQVNLMQIYKDKPAYIYKTDSETDAKAVACRIHSITGKEIIENA